MRRKKIIWHLYPPFLGITLISLLVTTVYVTRFWRQLYQEQLTTDLVKQARLAEAQINPLLNAYEYSSLDESAKYLGQQTGIRFTVMLPDGKVVGDSAYDPAKMENHADRPEFQEARKGAVGISVRQSYTLEERMIYAALPIRVKDRITGIMRAALPVTYVDKILREIYLKIIAGGLVIILVAAIVIYSITRRLSRPLTEINRGAERFARGDLSSKVPVPEAAELASLAEALNNMAAQLDDRFRTILRQRQEQEAILASMVEGVVAVDMNDRLITLNKAGSRLLMVNPEVAKGQSIQEIIRNQELQRFLQQTRTATIPVEGELTLNGLSERIIQLHGSKLLDAQGKVIGVLLVMNDVTKMRRLERIRRDFVANVSHELRTPITSIKGFVETLQSGAIYEPDNAVHFLNIMARQADRLNQIIEDLLTLSRIEQEEEEGKVTLTWKPLKTVLQAAIQVCEVRAAEKQITISLSCPDNLQARINPPLLEEAVVNLIDNAIKYSPPETAVAVTAEPATEKVLIRVRDQGRGIALEHLPRLFERFYRVDTSRSRKVGGTGLGLAIVKHIAQAHDGWVTVDSTLGQGSVFTLHLPLSA
ncbi:ATP-binding protein [Desulfobacca acetoxidans]|uniref:histidine kinase n=1 Tax=Desulfobacca acetoxidans (strain ATCC 700848 / DSM 11109 / ASRB2) TaxID=880072 RepID=F2NDV5_DESAR|nr:ATP-binding protein [Desulfobacca acetoxidans]AEB10452.1 multi-sensor signal transduction histidine kinase [Desulfobacca acetoxidans DSM 11109]HAY21614.1 HAMP domain-containing protein [Desulfobacterales bacterium]